MGQLSNRRSNEFFENAFTCLRKFMNSLFRCSNKQMINNQNKNFHSFLLDNDG